MEVPEIYELANDFCHINMDVQKLAIIITKIQGLSHNDRRIFLENLAGRVQAYREIATDILTRKGAS